MKARLLSIFAAISLAACNSTPLKINSEADISTNSTLAKVNAKALLKDENIELPSNYDVGAFYQLQVTSYIDKVDWQTDAKKTDIDTSIISKLMENELSRTKRFNVLSRNCVSCDYEYAYQIENTKSEGAIEKGEQLNPDFIIENSIALGTVIKEKYDHNEIIFRSVVTSKIINPTTGEIVHAFAPIRYNSPAKNYFVVNGKYLGGFNLNNHNELQEAYKDAAQRAVQILVTRVMDYYPVGGQVTNYRSGRIAINAGIQQGFATKQPVIFFLSDDGLDIPIASGEITPKQDGGAGKILKWKDEAEAQEIKAKLDALGKDYLKINKIFAVSVGTPASWKL